MTGIGPAESKDYGGQPITSNILVSGLRIESTGGDGVFAMNATNISITNVDSNKNYRQGISIVDVDGLLVENCSFRNTNGTGPSDGIDMEPDGASQRLHRIIIRNVHCANNTGGALGPSRHPNEFIRWWRTIN